MLGAVVVPLFVPLDWFALPAPVFERFLQYRAGLAAALALQLVLIRITRPSRFSFLHGYAFTLMVAGVISWMTVELGGFDSPYYVGLNLAIAANLLLPWRPVHAVLNSLLTVLVYVVLNSIFGGPFHTAVLLNDLSFLGAAAVIAVITARIRYRLVRREHQARTGLLEANAALGRSRAELKAARDALWGEMEVAKRIQTALLPREPSAGRLRGRGARWCPAAEVGGDYYDSWRPAPGERWVAIGDVSGHGVESGLVMMMTQTSILSTVARAPGSRTPAEVFSAGQRRASGENISPPARQPLHDPERRPPGPDTASPWRASTRTCWSGGGGMGWRPSATRVAGSGWCRTPGRTPGTPSCPWRPATSPSSSRTVPRRRATTGARCTGRSGSPPP